ncbi:hypothetical protein FOZ60_011805 [Perkinsus olseni]|uniref:Uncharacterized protein n=1 Tax=Perkinsus olseni TaxID=32597 RepID=A0A7J6PLY1_PEROL|nr:hypothetical protein FOZ60_011805 [Perkinsus olseni]
MDRGFSVWHLLHFRLRVAVASPHPCIDQGTLSTYLETIVRAMAWNSQQDNQASMNNSDPGVEETSSAIGEHIVVP